MATPMRPTLIGTLGNTVVDSLHLIIIASLPVPIITPRSTRWEKWELKTAGKREGEPLLVAIP